MRATPRGEGGTTGCVAETSTRAVIRRGLVFALLVFGLGCGSEGVAMDDEACPAQPRICEPFTFVREDDGVSLRSAFDQDMALPPSEVHCVLEAIRDGRRSTHSFTDGFPAVSDEGGAQSRQYRIREVAVFGDGHVEVIDSATPSFPDPATPEPQTAHFAIRPDTFFEECLDSTDAEVLRDCLWGFEAEAVEESGCRPAAGAPARGGG